CTGITLTSLPDGVTEIGEGAFYGCTSLDKIIMEPTTAPTLGTDAFTNTSSGLTFYVPKGGTEYDSGGWENLTTVQYSPTASLALDRDTLQLEPTKSKTLIATLTPTDAVPIVLWESSDTGVATVDDSGNVTAVSIGTATITATSRQGGKTATCAVTVKTAPPATIPVAGVTLNHSAYTLYTNKDPRSFQLAATVEPADASNKAVSWKSSDINIATVDASGNVTAVKVGTATITVTTTDGGKTATCTITVKTDSSGNSNGGGGGNGGGTSRNYIITTPEPPKPNNPVLAVIELPVSVTEGKPATGKPDDGRTASAIAEAGRDAKAKTNGIAVQYDAKTSLTYDGFSIVIQRATLDRLIAAKVKYVTLNTGVVDLTLDLAALGEIQKQATGDITLTATRETGLAGDALAAVGSRPAYRLSVGYTGADGKAAAVQSFGAGRITVGLAYKPAATEQTGSLFLVYSADGKGAEWLYQSSYDRTSGNVLASTGHFSVYGVGYKPAPAFADTVNHWAKADIDFVASRGLLAGTGDAAFTPDGTMTRGMFVVALGRLAGIDPAAYPSSRFTDVAADAYYAPYVEWAASKGIVTGTGEKTFSPDATITREQMAAIMQRYADRLGYTLPVAREAVTFTDDNQITGSMKNAVQAIQQAGIMSGKGNNRFGPKDTATRAEAAAVLRRFVEIVIDPAAAGGWGQNDAGRWLWYLDGKPVTGWKQLDGTWYYFDASGLMEYGGWREIGGKWYYFYPDGAMAVNTKIDGYEIGPDGVRNEQKD
ncbi:S-layer homology domain-containing protein, partial [Lachnoclostridium pacaense]|uniref:S-layer homology domain-containing protein n=1 Tax=Enterocloster hominis (ex Hitch et al. 2024) TaxID=1917870 RepID=UPI001D11282F